MTDPLAVIENAWALVLEQVGVKVADIDFVREQEERLISTLAFVRERDRLAQAVVEAGRWWIEHVARCKCDYCTALAALRAHAEKEPPLPGDAEIGTLVETVRYPLDALAGGDIIDAGGIGAALIALDSLAALLQETREALERIDRASPHWWRMREIALNAQTLWQGSELADGDIDSFLDALSERQEKNTDG